MTQNRQFLFVVMFFLFLAGILYWVIWGNRGEFVVNLEAPFAFSAEKFRRFDCTENPCTMSIPRGERTMCIDKEGFYSVCQSFSLPWKKTVVWNPVLKLIPRIVDMDTQRDIKNADPLAPPPLPLPPSPDEYANKKNFTYNNDTGELFYNDANDEKTLITRFFGIESPVILPFGKNLILHTDQEAFFVDVQKRKKTRIFMGKDIKIQTYQNDFTVISNEKSMSYFQSNPQEILPLSFSAKLEHIAFCEKNMIFYATQSGDILTFFEYFIKSGEIKELASAKGNGDFRLRCGRNSKEFRIIYPNFKEKLVQF